jgi:hypothetical protein
MDVSYYLDQAERCRRLARESTDQMLRISLHRLADEHSMRADEIENDAIHFGRGQSNDG